MIWEEGVHQAVVSSSGLNNFKVSFLGRSSGVT